MVYILFVFCSLTQPLHTNTYKYAVSVVYPLLLIHWSVFACSADVHRLLCLLHSMFYHTSFLLLWIFILHYCQHTYFLPGYLPCGPYWRWIWGLVAMAAVMDLPVSTKLFCLPKCDLIYLSLCLVCSGVIAHLF